MHQFVGFFIVFGIPLLGLYLIVRIARFAWKGK